MARVTISQNVLFSGGYHGIFSAVRFRAPHPGSSADSPAPGNFGRLWPAAPQFTAVQSGIPKGGAVYRGNGRGSALAGASWRYTAAVEITKVDRGAG
jgi:hypothetical protein